MATTDNGNRERAIFEAALEIASAEGRLDYLKGACGGDAALLARVQALLRAHEAPEGFLPERPRDGGTVSLVTEKPGDKIGHYKLLEQIGEGGCGVVYMAEQTEPIRRRVAFKVIKLGMDTKHVIARFEAERQALALMDHPNIAKVLDAGATETGRPYFVMELVRGVKITDYCDENRLSTEERLNLFVQVCHAIQHAHQKGVIHRDIKPSNILVTLNDGVRVPKVIDFGIAKAIGRQLTDKTVFTAFEQLIGTPAYMSPEQAVMTSLDIDTRSDIYALGVLLYELLTGHTPFDQKELVAAGLDEMRRIIREQEPARPSTRLSTLADPEQTTVAKRRHSEPPQLIHLVRGDLDWIVMKSLEKDRTRRYETANGLANDVLRHLNNEPVSARPPSKLYRFQKLVRRNKLAFGAAAAVAAALVGGAAVSTYLAVRANQAEREQSRLRQQADNQRQQAEQLRATAEDQARQIGRQLYASHMNVAFQTWQKGDLSRVERLLDDLRPKPGAEDLRGFEWFYLWGLCHSDQLTLHGHHALLRCVTFSPDGRLVATAGDDSTARIWDARTGQELHILSGHNRGVTSVAFAPDGKTLATGGGDQAIRLWDRATGEELAVLRGHNHGVTALAFGPNGKWLASATGRLAAGGNANPYTKYADPTPLAAEVKLWDVQARKATLTLTNYTTTILSLAVSPDGERLATGSADSTVKLWKVATGEMEMDFEAARGPVFAVAFSPDGRTLAAGGGNPRSTETDLGIWDLGTRRGRMLRGHEGPVFALAFAPDGRTLASCGLDQVVRLWNTDTGSELRTIKGHRAPIWSVAYDPEGKRIATASWDQTVKVWDAQNEQGVQRLPRVNGYSFCFTPDSKFLIAGGRQVNVLELGTTKPPFTLPEYETGDISVAVAPDGSLLASAGVDGIVTLWEVGTWRRVASLRGHQDTVGSLAFSRDSRTLVSGDDKTVRFWDVDRRLERAVPTSVTPFFIEAGGTLVTGGSGKTFFWDTATGRLLRSLPLDSAGLAAISPDGRYFATRGGWWDPALGLIEAKTMQTKWEITAHRASIWRVNFSPDSKTLATASWDGTAKLWDAATGQEMFTYKAPMVVWCATFSPDGNWLAIGSYEVALLHRSSISETDTAPGIQTQPASQKVIEGSTVTLTAFAIGSSPLFYQWRNGPSNLAGQTNARLTLTNVSRTNTGNYSLVVTNAFGSARSSNASLSVLEVREEIIAEVNFQDKRPAGYSAYTYSQNRVTLVTKLTEMAGVGVGGTTGLVMTADGSGLTNNMDQDFAGFGVALGVSANRTNGINTTNLSLYRLYAEVKTAGLTGADSHGRVMWQFLTPGGIIINGEHSATFSTNYQNYSYTLSEGAVTSGSWSEFAANLDQINRVACLINADNWLSEYGADADNALYIGRFKFVRLVPKVAAGGRLGQ